MRVKDNKELSNKYWQEMVVILDKEMPVKRKRRILPWFFICGVASTFFVIGSILFYGQNKNAGIINTQVSKNEFAPKSKTLATVNKEKNKETKDLNLDSEKSHFGNTSKTSKDSHEKTHESRVVGALATQGQKSDNELFTLRNHNSPNTVNPALLEEIFELENHTSSNVTNPIIQENQKVEKGFQIITKEDQISQVENNIIIKDLVQVNQLGILKVSRFPTNHNISPLQPFNKEIPKNTLKFGVETEAFTHDYKNLGQYNIGLLANYTFNKSFYAIGGLNYAVFNKNVDFTQKILTRETLDETVLENIKDATTISSSGTNLQGVKELDVVSSLTNRLHYYIAFVGLGYKLNKRLSLESKISNYRLISAEYEINNTINESLTKNGYAALDQMQLDTKKPIHKNSMVAIGIGSQYLINTHWSIGIEGVWWPSFNRSDAKAEFQSSNTSADTFTNLFTNINDQSATLSTGITLRYVW